MKMNTLIFIILVLGGLAAVGIFLFFRKKDQPKTERKYTQTNNLTAAPAIVASDPAVESAGAYSVGSIGVPTPTRNGSGSLDVTGSLGTPGRARI